MDPLSVTAGALGITAFALESIKLLHNSINDLAEVKEVTHDISTSLQAILIPLGTLQELHIPDADISAAAKADLDKAGVANAVNRCGSVCNDFSKRLENWTRHSSGSKLSIRDRLTVGWQKEKIRTLQIRVQSCKSTVQLAVQTTQLMVQIRSEQSHGADRDRMNQNLQLLKNEIEKNLALTKQRRSDAIMRREQLQVEIAEAEDEREGILAMQEIDEQASILEEAMVSSGVLRAQVLARLTNQEIGDVLTEEDSIAMVGMPPSVVGRINQRIGNVTTRGGSRAAVGVFADDVRF